MAQARFVIERILPAAPAVVFEHWSRAESLARWMCPEEGMPNASVQLDFRVGGAFEIVMHGEQDFRQTGEYLEIVPERTIVLAWISHWMPEGERRTRVRIDLEPAGRGETRLVLTHDELPESDVYDGHQAGWTRILARLGDVVGEAASNPAGEIR